MPNLSRAASNLFDSICRIDEAGNEYWSGRELMPLLGYSEWKHFSPVISRAKLACENTGNPVIEHFSRDTGKNPLGGRPMEDYKLSRLGAYLVAMNGDPRKPEIASAQSYFAVKTREAEVVVPAQNERLRELELELELEKLKRDRETTFFAVTATMGEETGRRVMAEARGEQLIQLAPPAPETVFIEQGTDLVVGKTAKGRSLTSLLKDAGLNPSSKKDMSKAKERLKAIGIDYETGDGLEEAAYLRQHYVIAESRYAEARRILTQDNAAANLFVWGMQQKALNGQVRQARQLEG
ncbi:MAG: hypothetical protein KME42_13980 [Tildeniella nuda ZEHNDER 1965/U140]|jgi:hypothetical protein|nr:hypothetical protein [Tildeniella nuda ZEHNDER 1965/U140]